MAAPERELLERVADLVPAPEARRLRAVLVELSRRLRGRTAADAERARVRVLETALARLSPVRAAAGLSPGEAHRYRVGLARLREAWRDAIDAARGRLARIDAAARGDSRC